MPTKSKLKRNEVIKRSYGITGGNQVTSNIPWTLPDGSVYNASEISIATYRKMRKDYQINACLSVLRFTLQKIKWYVEGGNPKAKKHIEYSLYKIWARLIKSIGKSFWAGYSPNTKVFTEDEKTGLIIYKKIKDLAPESCKVKVKNGNFLGFTQFPGQMNAEFIPSDYAFWYVNDMEDGNFYGTSKLDAAYKPWYYSEIVHLFANRYYERFGEPAVIGRAPNEDIKDETTGAVRNAMSTIQNVGENLKSHSVATIPAEFDENGNPLYDLKYLESQMRGADFDTYLKRLDMEKARAMFIPDLLLGTGRVGSYELGKEHKATFITGLMGMMDDVTDYINRYIIPPLVELNFGARAEVPEFKYIPMSKIDEDRLIDVIIAMVKGDMVRPSIEQLSDRLGLSLEEVEAGEDIEDSDIKEEEKNKTKEKIEEKKKKIKEVVNKAKKNIANKQIERLKMEIKNILETTLSDKEQYNKLERIKLGYMGKFIDTFGEEAKPIFIKKEKEMRNAVLDEFMKRNGLDEIMKNVSQVLIGKNEKFIVESDFIDPFDFMPDYIKNDNDLKTLYYDEFKRVYEKYKDDMVASRLAESACLRVWKIKKEEEDRKRIEGKLNG